MWYRTPPINIKLNSTKKPCVLRHGLQTMFNRLRIGMQAMSWAFLILKAFLAESSMVLQPYNIVGLVFRWV
jgi:hypothetical protein